MDVQKLRRELLELSLAERRALGERLRAVPGRRHDATIPRRRVPSPCPLSFAQQRLWFLDQYEVHSSVYNIPMAVRLRGALDGEALRRALETLVARHEALRTTFAAPGGSPVQIIGPSGPFDLPVTDLEASPEAERDDTLRHLIDEAAHQPFDLERDLMLRARLFRLGEADHVLLLVVHHIAADGWSLAILGHELSAAYRAYTTGQPLSLPDLPIQYADYAIWQREQLAGPALEAELAGWRNRLAGAPALLELPTDRPRPAAQTFHGATETVTFPWPLLEQLQDLSRREGVTLFMTLLAAFNTLLSRYAAQEDVVVGTAIAGRTRAETEGLIGFFVNTLVLRTDLSGAPTFRELLRRVREVALEAYAHQDLPFETLVGALQPERSLAYSPLFQVMFIVQNAPGTTLALPDLSVTPFDVACRTAKFDLSLSLEATSRGLQAALEYSRDLFEASTVRRLLRHYETVLAGAVAEPERPVSQLPLLDAAERRHVLVEWNRTDAAYPRDAGLHELFDAQVERTPDAIAVECAGGGLTYRELGRQSNRLAHHLRRLGVGPNVPVGLALERSLDAVVAMLGILKAGGAYVPLDPAYPRDRVKYMLDDARPPVLVTRQAYRPLLASTGAAIVCLDADRRALEREPAGNLPGGPTAETAAYVLYTSGSTGRPKGVVGLHRGAVNCVAWLWRTFPFAPSEVCCLKTSLNFVDSVWELFGPLLRGIRSVIAPDEVLSDPGRLIETLAAHRVSRIALVPSHLRALLDAFRDLGRRLPDLGLWIASGEALPADLCDRFHARLPGRRLVNVYGCSEASGNSTWHETRPGAETVVPIGRPIDNTQIYVLDAQLQPAPVGVPGDLYIGGDGLARGYLDRPELTASRFVPDPFGDRATSRLYRTGDRARYRPDGNLEYLGRTDQQVKIRGFRVEPGEIEAVLAQHPAIEESVVLARDLDGSGPRLIAYLVALPGRRPEIDAVRSFLRETLPEHAIPSDFVFLDAFPLTPNGKLARDRLPAPAPGARERPARSRPPDRPLEIALAEIWKDVLGVTDVRAADRFFDLGGHSLQSMQVIAQIEERHGVRLSPRDLMTQNLAQLAALCEEHRGRAAEPTGPSRDGLLRTVTRLVGSRFGLTP